MLADRSGMWMEDEEVCGSGGRKGTRGLMWERWKEGILEGSEWGAAGFRTVRRTLDSDKRSIQSRFTPLVQSCRDKGDPQKQIRLLRPGTTVETKSSCAGQGSFNHAEMTSEKKKKCICGSHKIQVLPLLWFKSNSGKSSICLRKITCHTETRLGALEGLEISDTFRR